MTRGTRALIVLVVVLAAVTFACVSHGTSHGTYAEDVRRGNGMPLDAVEYETPSWGHTQSNTLYVRDRIHKKSWWLVPMRDNGGYRYVVLPIDEDQRPL